MFWIGLLLGICIGFVAGWLLTNYAFHERDRANVEDPGGL